jgi:hypothetical protein
VRGRSLDPKAGAYDLRVSWNFSRFDYAQTIVPTSEI